MEKSFTFEINSRRGLRLCLFMIQWQKSFIKNHQRLFVVDEPYFKWRVPLCNSRCNSSLNRLLAAWYQRVTEFAFPSIFKALNVLAAFLSIIPPSCSNNVQSTVVGIVRKPALLADDVTQQLEGGQFSLLLFVVAFGYLPRKRRSWWVFDQHVTADSNTGWIYFCIWVTDMIT